MTDADANSRKLTAMEPLMGPINRAVIRELDLPSGSRGLDAGCDIGLQAVMLSEAVGPAGHVTGLDLFPELLAIAEGLARSRGLSERLSFQTGDVRRLPFADGAFDWAWSSCCVGYAPLEPLPLIRELVRVVRPGGSVAIVAWSSETLLPGFPVLEAHLHATTAGIAPFVVGEDPSRHFLRALGWYREAGLVEAKANSFAGGAHAPLNDDLRRALTSLFEMRWSGVEEELPPEDREEYRRLCRPESPQFIVNHPDYCAFFTCTMFRGRVGASLTRPSSGRVYNMPHLTPRRRPVRIRRFDPRRLATSREEGILRARVPERPLLREIGRTEC